MAEAEVGAERAADIPVPARAVRMSLSQMKADRLQKKKRLAQVRSADEMSRSRDFASADGGGGSSNASSTPLRRTVSFSEETRVCRTLPSGALSDPGKTTAGRPNFNSRGELQVDSDDDDAYVDDDTHIVLRASGSTSPIQKCTVLNGFEGHPAVANIPQVGDDTLAVDAGMASSASSLESAADAAAAAEVGMIQADWMAVADSRYAQTADFRRLEVRLTTRKF